MKKNKIKKIIVLGLAMALTTGVMSACGGESGNDEQKSSGETVVIAGSTSVQPLSEVMAEEFMADNEGTSVEVQGGGSGQGIKSIQEGIADIGSLSREVKDEEKGSVKEEYIIAMDGVAVVVNTETETEDITIEELEKIYTGEITNWKELGGKDAEITVVSREEGSGTRGAFTEITGVLVKDDEGNETDNTTADALVQPSTGSVIKTVSSTPDSIGYVSLAAVSDEVKALKVEGVEPSKDTVLDGTYKISRPFVYVTGNDISESAKAFIDFVLSDKGQELVEENGFIPVQ
ncbi:MAG: phosphate ABC transporter substrate-binding protein [Eubacteriales bacterium]|nr:phosphate ABC transporter substrate-binding protein [Eubacteriales bacterium]NLF47202.1 phosphate ABC transporter substrate-binding protein [Clostridiales bacterium]